MDEQRAIYITSPELAMGVGFLFCGAVALACGNTLGAYLLTSVAIRMIGIPRALAYGMWAAPFARWLILRAAAAS